MKKKVVILLLGLSFIVFAFLTLKYDSKKYDYGCGCTLCDNTLPYNINPRYNFEYPQNFVLIDDDDFELVGSGFRYKRSSSKIKDFLGYGYNDTSILVKYADSLSNVKYLSSYETGYKSSKGNPEISFEEINKADFKQRKKNYKWTELGEGKAENVIIKRFLFFIATIVSLLLLLWYLIRKRKATE